MATATDPGKLIQAKLPGTCAECAGDIRPGDPIYFSRLHGPRHKRCAEPGDSIDANPAAPRDARDGTPRGGTSARDAADGGWRWDEGGDAPTPPDDAARRARATEFGRAGDRDAARRELGQVLDLLIEALGKIRRLLV